MRRIIYIFLGNRVRLLFWSYLLIAFVLTVRHNYHYQSSYLNSSNQLVGGLHQYFNRLSAYFSLDAQNKFLIQENKRLLEALSNARSTFQAHIKHQDSLKNRFLSGVEKQYIYTSGNIVKNNYTGTNNYLTLSLGTKDSVGQDMGVVNEKGIIGIVEKSGTQFSTVQSILHSQSRINAKIKGSHFFGTLIWNGEKTNYVQLIDVPDLAPVKQGDTIITGGMSSIFPEGLPIGTISSFKLTAAKNYYKIVVRLFNDMQNLGPVYVIKNKSQAAVKQIEGEENE